MDEAEPRIVPNTVRLQQAVLCANCEVISDTATDSCAVCGSRALLSLSRVLGGALPDSRAALIEVSQAVREIFTLTAPVFRHRRKVCGRR
jgi:hypothetical protein